MATKKDDGITRRRLIIIILLLLCICAAGAFIFQKKSVKAELQVQRETLVQAEKKIQETGGNKVKKSAPVKLESLDDIKQQFGKVEVLSLYDGRTFTGAVIERGDEIVFQTVSGKKTFDAKTVRDVRIIR